MSSTKKKGLIFIIISSIAFFPNMAALLIACFVLDFGPLILIAISGIMVIACIIGFMYGLSLRKKTDTKLDF